MAIPSPAFVRRVLRGHAFGLESSAGQPCPAFLAKPEPEWLPPEGGEPMEAEMLDEQFVTTAEEIRESREALIELGNDIAGRKGDAQFNEAQIVFANANARMELAPP